MTLSSCATRRSDLYADLGAHKLLGVAREELRVVIEVKGLDGLSFMAEFEQAVGQYVIYRSLLKQRFPLQSIYLAVPLSEYRDHMQQPGVQYLLQDLDILLLVFDENSEEVVQWTS
jgi:TATA-box binding protein (TBP) (component of TFIID and TFIIIB)